MSKAPAFQLYAADFYMDTVGWSCEEVGLYFRLLMAEWVNGPLPNDPVRLAKVCQMSLKRFDHNFKNVSPKFVQNGEGYLVNPRLETTRQKQQKFIDSQRSKGIKSGQVRMNPGSTPVQPEVNPSSSSSLTTKNKKRVSKKLTDSEYFEVLKNNTAYKGIDIDREKAKCEAWCLTNGKVFSRRRFINWLNRAERPMTIDRPITYTGRPKPYSELERLRQEDAERGEPSKEDIEMAKRLVDNLVGSIKEA